MSGNNWHDSVNINTTFNAKKSCLFFTVRCKWFELCRAMENGIIEGKIITILRSAKNFVDICNSYQISLKILIYSQKTTDKRVTRKMNIKNVYVCIAHDIQIAENIWNYIVNINTTFNA